MSETAQETTAVTATLVEHESEVLPAVTDEIQCIDLMKFTSETCGDYALSHTSH